MLFINIIKKNVIARTKKMSSRNRKNVIRLMMFLKKNVIQKNVIQKKCYS